MQVTPSEERPFPTPPTPNTTDLESARFASRNTVALPDEMVKRILMNLGTTDIAVCRSVSRQWQTVIDTRHLLARSFYRDCHLTQRINSPAVERNLAVERYHSHIRGWLADFSNMGRKTAEWLDNILEDKYFPEVLFFSIPKLLLNSNKLVCQNTATNKHSGVRNASFSPDGKYLVTVYYNDTAKLWEFGNGQWRGKVTFRHFERVMSPSFSSDGKLLMTASSDYICKIWRLEDDQWREKVAIQHSTSLINASLSPDGKHFVTASDKISAKIWRLEDDDRWEEKVTIKHSEQVMTVAQFSPDGKRLVTTFVDGTAKIWELDDGQWQEKFTIHDRYYARNARFSPDGKHLVTVSSGETLEWFCTLFHHAKIWELVDVQSQENVTIQQWQGKATIEHSYEVQNVHFSLDGKHLATASHDGTVKICGLVGGKWQEKATIRHSSLVENASFSRDGKLLVTASYDCTAKICGLIGGKWQEIVTIQHSKMVTNASFGPDYQLVTVSSDKTAKIWVLKDKENDDNS